MKRHADSIGKLGLSDNPFNDDAAPLLAYIVQCECKRVFFLACLVMTSETQVFSFIFFMFQHDQFQFLPLKMLFISWRTVIKNVKSIRTSVSRKDFFFM
jgi:hypothetical protein